MFHMLFAIHNEETEDFLSCALNCISHVKTVTTKIESMIEKRHPSPSF